MFEDLQNLKEIPEMLEDAYIWWKSHMTALPEILFCPILSYLIF